VPITITTGTAMTMTTTDMITTDVIMTDAITTAIKIGEVRRCRISLRRRLFIHTQDTAPAALQRAFFGDQCSVE